jgi:WAS family protein 1
MVLEMKAIAQNLRREEMIIELANSLQELDRIIDHLFESIDCKINSFASILSSIDLRTNICKEKVIELKTNLNKATKVFSYYKYPNNEISVQKSYYKSIESSINHKSIDINSNHLSNHLIKSQLIPFDELLIKDKMQFFNIKTKTKVLLRLLLILL